MKVKTCEMEILKVTIKNDLFDEKRPNRILRNKLRDRFLLKVYSIREMLKWKYNYYEANPREHGEFWRMQKRFQVYYRSMEFKKEWRLKMDELYYKDTKRMTKMMKKREEAKKHEIRESLEEMKNPAQLLLNYDREIVAMMQRVRDEYSFFRKFPARYPDIVEEKQNFLQQLRDSADHEFDFFDSFLEFWESRVALLCDREISEEKKLIRENWRQLLPVYYKDENIKMDELKGLLTPDDD